MSLVKIILKNGMVLQIQKLFTSNRNLGTGENIRKVNGMFSFAAWDRKKCLYLARDRFGESLVLWMDTTK